jgi:hypothetical protein
MSEDYTKLIEEYKKYLIETYKLIIIPPDYASYNKECAFCGEIENKSYNRHITYTYSFLYTIPVGILFHCNECKRHAYASLLFELVSNLMLPPEWTYGMELFKNYRIKYIKINRSLNKGKVIIRGVWNDNLSIYDFMWESLKPAYKDFMWDSLNEETQKNIKNTIKDKEWPELYPEWLKKLFKDLKQ